MSLNKKLIINFLLISIIFTIGFVIINYFFISSFIRNNYIKTKIDLTKIYGRIFAKSILGEDVLMGFDELNPITEEPDIIYIILRDFDNENFINYYCKDIDKETMEFFSKITINNNNEIDEYALLDKNILHISVPIIEGLNASICVGYDIKPINSLYNHIIFFSILFAIVTMIVFIFIITRLFSHLLSPLTSLSKYISFYGEHELMPDKIKIKSNSIEINTLIRSFKQMIHDRKLLKENIKQEKRLLHIFTNRTAMEISLWDNELYLIDLNNESMKNFPDYEKENIIGKHISKLIPGFEKTERYNEYRKVIKTGKSYFEHTSFKHNEKLKHVKIEAFSVDNGLGVIIADITELKEQQKNLQQRDKMRSLGELAGGIAHDFNNQLAGIMGGANLILMHTNESNTKENAKLIIKSSEKSAELINQLLAFTRKGQYTLKTVSMHYIINEVLKILNRSISKQILIKSMLNAKIDTVKCDENQIENMILNICFNARDSINGNGEISVVTDITELDIDYCSKLIYLIEPGKYFTLSITDSGIGMDKETVNMIFEPFYTTKPVGKGTGMGLASVYGTIKNHKGAINVYSEKGHGSTFKVYLPLSIDTKINIEEKINDVDVSILKDKCILMIDDEKMILDVSEKILKNIGMKPILFENGRNAIEYYKQNYKEIDIVFIDMIMPEISGSELFDELITINPKMKSVISSGYSSNGRTEDIMKRGATSFLQKPYTVSELKETIYRVLSQ